jgi:hypothetical protein
MSNDPVRAALADRESGKLDLGFLPKSLTAQCQALIESYHELHGYGCLPNFLWKAGLGELIETHHELRQLLKKASTARSAKKSDDGFVQIAATLLSIEIVASRFVWRDSIDPRAESMARRILRCEAQNPPTPLMELYLYPPKLPDSAPSARSVRNREASEVARRTA